MPHKFYQSHTSRVPNVTKHAIRVEVNKENCSSSESFTVQLKYLLRQFGMGVVTVSTSASRTPVGLSTKFQGQRSTLTKPLIVAFKSDKSNNTSLVALHEQIPLPVEAPKIQRKRPGKGSKSSTRVKAVSTDVASPCSLEVDYNEAAAKLENIYKVSPAIRTLDVDDTDGVMKRSRRMRKRTGEGVEKTNDDASKPVVKNLNKKPKILNLDKRIELRKNKIEEVVIKRRKSGDIKAENEKIERLVRDYSSLTDLVSLDWKKMKIHPVLSSTKHSWLFKLMQPMKALLQVKDSLQKDLGREVTEAELAVATKMDVVQMKKCLEVGRAARNKLIKNNLRLVLFIMNIYFHDFANGPKFQDLCQAGVKVIIAAIDRFESKRRFRRLSTYGLFWIRHAIILSITVSSFTRVPFGLELVRVDVQRTKLELLFKLQRLPTEEEIIEKVGISPERYREVMEASKPVLSLHSKHAATQEEYISGISDPYGVETGNRKQPALLSLALDDVLDSLKPNESLVI